MKPVRRMWDGAPLKAPQDWKAIMEKKKASQEKKYAPDDDGDEDVDEDEGSAN